MSQFKPYPGGSLIQRPFCGADAKTNSKLSPTASIRCLTPWSIEKPAPSPPPPWRARIRGRPSDGGIISEPPPVLPPPPVGFSSVGFSTASPTHFHFWYFAFLRFHSWCLFLIGRSEKNIFKRKRSLLTFLLASFFHLHFPDFLLHLQNNFFLSTPSFPLTVWPSWQANVAMNWPSEKDDYR